MKILAIETSGNISSVAVVSPDIVLGEFTINHKKTHSQTIMPMIDNLLTSLDFKISDMSFIAYSNGPGSFTGLRIGAATAKALGHGLSRGVKEVPTLDALAYNLKTEKSLVVPILDARQNQVYACVYKDNEKLTDYMAIEFDKLLDSLEEKAIFLGDAVELYKEKILAKGHDVSNCLQNAGAVGLCAIHLPAKHYAVVDLQYVRKPQAQREYEEKNADKQI